MTLLNTFCCFLYATFCFDWFAIVSWCWDWLWRRGLFEWEVAELGNLQANLPSPSKDAARTEVRWELEKAGGFSIGSWRGGLETFRFGEEKNESLYSCWKVNVPHRISFFLWLTMQGRLATRDYLRRCHILQHDEVICPLCLENEESVHHLFLHCAHADSLWAFLLRWAGCTWVRPRNVEEAWEKWPEVLPLQSKHVKGMWQSLLAAVFWSLWLQRNAAVFGQTVPCSSRVLHATFGHWQNWLKCSDPSFPYTAEQMLQTSDWCFRWGWLGVSVRCWCWFFRPPALVFLCFLDPLASSLPLGR